MCYLYDSVLTLLEPKSRFGDKPLKFRVVCPQNGTAVLKGLKGRHSRIMDFTTHRYQADPCGSRNRRTTGFLEKSRKNFVPDPTYRISLMAQEQKSLEYFLYFGWKWPGQTKPDTMSGRSQSWPKLRFSTPHRRHTVAGLILAHIIATTAVLPRYL